MATQHISYYEGIVIGLDVHLSQVTACAIIPTPDGQHCDSVFKEFSTFTEGLKSMAQWCRDLGPDAVIMESTGIYWKSPYRALCEVGIIPQVVNAWHIKNVPGRKTDMNDSQWLAIVGRGGLVKKSFVPTPEFDRIRNVSREVQKLTSDIASRKNRIDRLLSNLGIRLSVVVSDIHGVAARDIIERLIEGWAPEKILETVNTSRLKASKEQLLLALDAQLTPSDRFLLERQLFGIRSVEAEAKVLLDELYRLLSPYQKELNLLQTIPGLGLKGAAMVLAEIGPDMDAFGSSDRLASWTGLCPGNNESAGKRRSGRTRKGNRWIRRIPREAAHAAARTKTMLQAKYKSLVVRRGAKRSIVAVAHKMIRIIYAILKKGVPYYDSTVNYEKIRVEKNASRWLQILKKHGYLDPMGHPRKAPATLKGGQLENSPATLKEGQLENSPATSDVGRSQSGKEGQVQTEQSVGMTSPKKRGRPRKVPATPKEGQLQDGLAKSNVGCPENEAIKPKRGRPKKVPLSLAS